MVRSTVPDWRRELSERVKEVHERRAREAAAEAAEAERERVTRAEVAALAREVDSLARVKKLVETDKDTQERVAREQYGMLRAGETEFTLVRPGR